MVNEQILNKKYKNVTIIMNFQETTDQEIETVKLCATDKCQEVQVSVSVTTDLSFIDVNNYICKNENIILIRINNTVRTSTIHLTNISPYAILSFDENLEFKGVSYSINGSKGDYSINTQYKTLLFLRLPLQLELDQITNLKIT
tara:strand:- start:15948 stop:16379 length:432 start_codon:yes stop_codon:yes gene_type:complete